MLAAYGSSIAQLRLQVRGVNPLLAVPVAVNEVDVATPTGRAVVVLGFMTYFVLVRGADGRACIWPSIPPPASANAVRWRRC